MFVFLKLLNFRNLTSVSLFLPFNKPVAAKEEYRKEKLDCLIFF